jgi:hypothetical protein
MARPETLVAGNCYFKVGFFDRDLLVPWIMTLVYVRPDVDDDGQPGWLFRDHSMEPVDEPGEADAHQVLLRIDASQLHSVLDFDGLARRLREIATFHPLQPVPAVPVEPPTEFEFMPIAAAVERALVDPDCVSVTMVVRFTDDAISIGRKEDGCRLRFFTHPIVDPDEDARVRALFERLGQAPVTDYPADRGRTRVLEYAMAADREAVAARCRQVFEEVHRIRKGDVIECHVLTKADVDRMKAES